VHRWVEDAVDETAARNPLPEDYEPDEHLVYLVYGKFKARANDVGFLDTRWVTLEEMLDEIGVNHVQPEIDIFECEMKDAREEAMGAAAMAE
jgi:hypothetical protein